MFDDMMAAIEARPKNLGPMKDANGRAKIKGPCGDTVEVWLRIDGGRIRKATFMSDGCGYSQYCCSVATRLAEGMPTNQAAEMTQQQVLDAVGTLPEDHRHCALLAANTIKAAIADYRAAPSTASLWQRLQRGFRK
jgi:nitrogen fixation NifU-like protein